MDVEYKETKILVFEKEKRFDPKRGDYNNSREKDNKKEKRSIKGVSRDELVRLVEVLRDEQTTLINFIADKELKKFQVFRFQLAAMAILGVSTVASLPLLEGFISSKIVSDMLSNSTDVLITTTSLFILLNIVILSAIISVNLMSAAVIRHILSIKSSVTLAVRQLNCNREGIQRAMSGLLCGSYPVEKEYRSDKPNSEWYEAEILYLSHNKFPTSNKSLRAVFFRRQRNTLIKIAYYLVQLISPKSLTQRQKPCTEIECENKKKGLRCFTLSYDNEVVHYGIDDHDDIHIDYDTKTPNDLFERILLLGYRASYVQSADMMAVLATFIATILVSILLPLSNLYMWFRIETFGEVGHSPAVLALFFVVIELILILFFAYHFSGIMYRAMNKIVKILVSESSLTK